MSFHSSRCKHEIALKEDLNGHFQCLTENRLSTTSRFFRWLLVTVQELHAVSWAKNHDEILSSVKRWRSIEEGGNQNSFETSFYYISMPNPSKHNLLAFPITNVYDSMQNSHLESHLRVLLHMSHAFSVRRFSKGEWTCKYGYFRQSHRTRSNKFTWKVLSLVKKCIFTRGRGNVSKCRLRSLFCCVSCTCMYLGGDRMFSWPKHQNSTRF